VPGGGWRQDPSQQRVRAGNWVRIEARKRHFKFWRAIWQLIALLVILAVVASAIAWFFAPPFAAGMVIGSIAVLVPCLIWIATIQATGTAGTLMGGTAEQWTSDALRKLLEPRGWYVVDDVLLERGNIDHVAVGPEGALAVETKWSSREWLRADDLRVEQAANQSHTGAERVKGLLRTVKLTAPVRPLVVLWGHWSGEQVRHLAGDVHVVHGELLDEWVTALQGKALDETQVKTAAECIRAYVRMRDAHRPTESVFVEHSPQEIGIRLLMGFVAGLLGIVIAAGLLAALNWWAFGVNAALAAGGAAAYRFAPRWRHVTVGWTSGVAGMTITLLVALAIVILV